MKHKLKRGLLAAACGALVTAVLIPQLAVAQAWPVKPVRIIVPFPPGGGLDFFTRIVAQKLQENVGQQCLVENRSGAGGMIGAEAGAKAPPDGY
ncbi:MAG TPA: tripartite tricarboxylate transporter substrate-binding protein, partial [Burkholderiales bacterium]|nr:tripartite tricarboxylate transporter substrate-binding protein [Burkholderiales bacterium]